MHSLLVKSILAATFALILLKATASAQESPTITASQRYGQSCRGSVGGLPVLVLRGTHRERGEAHGFMGAREIVKTCDAMAAAVNLMGEGDEGRTGWDAAKGMVGRFQFPERFQAELEGMLRGIEKALPDPGDRTLGATGAELTLEDLMVLQCGDVLELMRCSQFSAWGSLTPDGGTIIGRNWDYPPIFHHDTYCAFAVDPAEDNLQKTMDAMWFGMIGAGMACLNEEGVYLSGNDAGSEDPSQVQSPVPAALAIRMTAETTRASDPPAALEQNIDQRTVLALLYHIVAPGGPDGQAPQAFVFEYAPGATSPFEARIRRASEALPDALILTNHLLLTGAGDGGSADRYARIETALGDPSARGKVHADEVRSILDSVAASGPGTTTQYSAIVIPGRKEVRIAVAPAPGEPATKQEYVRLQWDAVFGLR
jgi:hypothetical protein